MIEKFLYLDNINVGDTFESSNDYELTEDEIIRFAKQYDPQIFHTDSVGAEDTFFQGLASSGWLTASASMRLTVETLPVKDGLIGASVDMKWPSASRIGDRLKIKLTITNVTPSRSKPNQGIVSYETVTTNQFGEVRQILNANILCFRKSIN